MDVGFAGSPSARRGDHSDNIAEMNFRLNTQDYFANLYSANLALFVDFLVVA